MASEKPEKTNAERINPPALVVQRNWLQRLRTWLNSTRSRASVQAVVRITRTWTQWIEGAGTMGLRGFVNSRPERARSAVCAPLQGAPWRRARALSPGKSPPDRRDVVSYLESRGTMEARLLHRERPMRHGRLKVSRSAETLSLVLVALACPSHSTGPASGGGPPGTNDWTRFGWDAGGSNAPPIATGITAANVATLVRQQVAIDGTVDASAIYLHRVPVNGSTHDVFFVTTTYGKTLAIDAQNGAVLWRYTPANYASWAGSAQVTTATPVADPNRQFVYAAAPDGASRQLKVPDGSVVGTTPIALLPGREKIASALNYFNGRVIATTTGYIGDAPPYQGHVAVLDGATGNLLSVWNTLCSNRPGLIDPASCSQSGSGIWGRTGAGIVC